MPLRYNDLNSMQIDVLKELGNIGAGSAVTALSKMINKRIDMEVPKVELVEFNKLIEALGGPEELYAGVYFQMYGDLTGNILFLLPYESSKKLIDILLESIEYACESDVIEKSSLEELGNIMASSYVSSLAALTCIKINISVPALAIDMAGAILSVPAIQYSETGDEVLLIETSFSQGMFCMKGIFLLIPHIESFDRLLTILGVV